MRNPKLGAASILLGLLVAGFPTSAESQTLTGTLSGELFGFAVAPAGDINKDSRDDFLIGVPLGKDNGAVGRVEIYLGKSQNYPSTPVRTLSGEVANSQFGFAVAGVGDVNGDGYDDFLVGAPTAPGTGGEASGKVYLYLGGTSTPSVASRTWSGDLANAHFGFSVGGGFDFNKDGLSDFVVGAPGHNGQGTRKGQVTIFFGNATVASIAPQHVIYGDLANWALGHAVDSAGDVNNDGYDDVIAGAPQLEDQNSGRAVIWLGKASVATPPSRILLQGEFGTDRFGFDVSRAGDLNGDGYDDVLVGAPDHDNAGTNKGAIYAYRGGSSMNSTFDWKAVGAVGGNFLGYSVDGGMDHSGDGVPDILAGVPGSNTLGAASGEAFFFLGKSVPSTTPDRVLSPNPPVSSAEADDRFGASVRFIGSFNGDAYAEIGVGAPQGNITSGSTAGYVNLFAELGTITPVLLLSFQVERSPSGADIRWELRDAHELSGLRVEAVEGEHTRDVHAGWLSWDARSIEDAQASDAVTAYRLWGRDRVGGVRLMGETVAPGLPAGLVLGAPNNPFRDRVRMAASGIDGGLDVSVWDATGRRLRVIPIATLQGATEIEWDGRDENGSLAPAGVYFIRVRGGAREESVKVVRLF